jgi:DNA-binding MarR family transcriptional regulator
VTDRLSDDEQLLWRAWKHAAEQVRERVAADIRGSTGLSDPDFGILTRLVDLGDGALRQNELAASMHWHRSRLSHQLTRMQERGLVARETVRGGVIVTITPAGRVTIDRARPVHAAAVRAHLLEPLSRFDRADVTEMLAALTR